MNAASGSPELSWTFDPAIILALLAYGGLYVWRFRKARAQEGGRGAGVGQAVFFFLAMVALVIALVSPVDALGAEYLFSAHMVQHVLLGDIAPALVLLALSRVILRPATRRLIGVERALGRLAHPATAITVWFVLVYVWHIPALYNAALVNPMVHALEHASFFAAGIALWWPLIQPIPMRHGLAGLGTFAYIAVAKIGLGVLGLYLVWSPNVAYSFYETVPRIWGLTALEDQSIGGGIMMAEQSFVLAIAFAVLFVRMLIRSEEEERRRERLEDAAAA